MAIKKKTIAKSPKIVKGPPPGMKLCEDGSYIFAPGNELWKRRLRHGIKERKFETAEALVVQVLGYFHWAAANPLEEAKLASYEGVHEIVAIPKMRAMTLAGLCEYCGISRETWGGWRRGGRPDLADVISFAEQHMWNHKFDGASAGLLNPNIIAKDLGLVDRKEFSGPDGKPIVMVTSEMTAKEAAEAYNSTLGGFNDEQD